jgi:formylglycine-generating enzyme required for sulfatase activity
VRGALAIAFATLFASGAGCAQIAGFEEFHKGCPSDVPDCRGAGGTAGALTGGTGGSSTAVGGDAGDASRDKSAGGTSASTAGMGGVHAGGTVVDSGLGCDSTRPGPAMAPVKRPDGTTFWIDITEVTVGEYTAFLRDHGPVADDDVCPGGPIVLGDCVANRRAHTDADGGAGPPPDAGVASNLPQVCVDWCEAKAFCEWAGKRLCHDDLRAAQSGLLSSSECFAACTEGKGTSTHDARYGCGASQTCGASTCNGSSGGPQHLLAVGVKTGCAVTSAVEGCLISDLSGNASEWTDGCDYNMDGGNCAVRGGDYESSDSDILCEAMKPILRTKVAPTLGFRCCADPHP